MRAWPPLYGPFTIIKGILYSVHPEGVWRSDDCGATWNRVSVEEEAKFR